MGQLKATEKLERLLSMIPWIMDNDGPTMKMIAKRFGYPEDLLLNDLTKVLFMVGPYPHTPDTLIEVLVEDGRVWIGQADWLARPIRLTPEQGFSILRKAKAMDLIIGEEDGKELRSAVAKLEASLGQNRQTFGVDIPELRNNVWLAIDDAIDMQTQLEIDYYSYSKDQTSTRIVHPIQLLNRDHNQYLYAYCETASDYRLFRLDRILVAKSTSHGISVPEESLETFSDNGMWNLAELNNLITLKITTEDSWIVSTYPVERVVTTNDGFIEVDLYVTGIAWLKRLLLRLKPETQILKAPEHIPYDLARQAAQSIVDRYKV